MKNTTFKQIIGYEGLYSISEKGDVKSESRKINNGVGFRFSNEFLMKHYDNGHGYNRVCLSNGKSRKFHLVHKLLAIHFIPNPNNYPIINHKDGNKKNNDLSNLEWCDYSHNNQHGYDTGLIKALQGEKHKNAKLSEKEVLEIIELLYKNDLKQSEIAEIYKVSSQTINSINKQTTWKHLRQNK